MLGYAISMYTIYAKIAKNFSNAINRLTEEYSLHRTEKLKDFTE